MGYTFISAIPLTATIVFKNQISSSPYKKIKEPNNSTIAINFILNNHIDI